ncbi:hypothetical protein [Antrihabitans stalactiti]|uniref:hypothetical protein n=1 Tax=Antrihabitans stalactiti TaxID=2584121 RepID=UPI00146B2241|nr:hypothetical protein [Antrihabitans stalactiti]
MKRTPLPPWVIERMQQLRQEPPRTPNELAEKVRGTGHVSSVLLHPDLLVCRVVELWG